MVGALWMVYEIRGWYTSAVSLFGEALDSLDETAGDEAKVVTRAVTAAAQAWFLALQGRQAEGVLATASATEALRASTDFDALWLALNCRSLNLAYVGEDWSGVADEGIALGQKLDGPVWTAAFKNWRGGAALMAGDFDAAQRFLLEGMNVYDQLDEHYWRAANLQHQAQVATAEGRTDDAIDLYGRSTDRARQIGALRVLQMSSAGLGDANLAVGNFSAADAAFIESLSYSEQMGMVAQMLSIMTKIAQIRSQTGKKGEAVEILASVVAEPASAFQAIFDSRPTNESAMAALDALEREMDRDEFSQAHETGTSKPYDVVIKELIASEPEHRI